MPTGYFKLLLLAVNQPSAILNNNPLPVFLFDNSFLASFHYREDRFDNLFRHNFSPIQLKYKAQPYTTRQTYCPKRFCCMRLYKRDFHPHCFLPPYNRCRRAQKLTTISNHEVLERRLYRPKKKSILPLCILTYFRSSVKCFYLTGTRISS